MHIILLHHKLFCPTVPDQIFLSTCYKPGHFYETRRSILTCVSELLHIDYILTNNRDNCHARHYFFRVETAEQLLSLCNPTYSGHAWLCDHGCGVLREWKYTVAVYSCSIANNFDIDFYCICLEILCQIALSSLGQL